MQRKTALRRKGFVKKEDQIRSDTRISSKARLAQKSKRQKEREARYWPIQKQFLIDNPYCGFCFKLSGKKVQATECHHINGRYGELMFALDNLVPSCRGHRDYPHTHPLECAKMGFMPASIVDRLETFAKLKGVRVFVTS